MNLRRTLAVAACAVMLSSSCTGDTSRAGADGSDPSGTSLPVVELGEDDVVLTSALVRFDDCDALLSHLHDEYAARVGPWGFDGDGWHGWPEPMMLEMADEAMGEIEAAIATADEAEPAAAQGGDGGTAPVEGVDYSGTNVQEAGVDEADIVKTDGRRIFTLSQGRLVAVDVATRAVLGSAEIAEGHSTELFIDGDDLLVIVSAWDDDAGTPETVMQRISVDADSGTPTVVETLRVQGSYLSARSVGGVARVITRFDPHHNFPFVYPQSEAGEQAAEDANRAAVLGSTLGDWLPRVSTGDGRASAGSLLSPCDTVHAPSVFSGFGVTTVVSVPVGGAFDPSQSAAVTAPGDIVYASPESLYIATARWLDLDETDGDEDAWAQAWRARRTSVHRFATPLSGNARYEASGDVLGVIRDQFSLSEHDGHLRVVTTVGGPWGDDTESQVRVLRQDGDRLDEVGSVGDIGRGEDVQAVRFVGDVGYVVTFRQIDPFYTIDLSDPTSPQIVGELKIPGFSSYLHPISDDLVLGVGSDADLDGRVTGSKVSLFDVSDLSDPREVAIWTAPDGWSDVSWDHRAFLYWAPRQMAVVPVTVWGGWSGAVVLEVGDATVTEIGRVEHLDEWTAPVGCRRLTAGDVAGAATSDLSQLIDNEGAEVLACVNGGSPESRRECYPEHYLDDQAVELELLSPRESVILCWVNEPRTIARSMVIGSELWTLGNSVWGFDASQPSRLEAHDLATFERLAALPL